jgi:phytanoyl-CoA hydroxylase
MTESAVTTPENLPSTTVDFFRSNGFVKVPQVISSGEVDTYREAVIEFQEQKLGGSEEVRGGKVFHQFVNVWRENERLKPLTLHPNVGRIAEKLTGVPLRLWHDHILTKPPHNEAPTEFHQDQPYWPHENSPNPISAWIALVDVPVEKGCMTFIPGSFRHTDLPSQNLNDANSLFSIRPDLRWESRMTLPLQAGDCTFHHGRCAHMATPNLTEDSRYAYVVIYVDQTTTYRASKRHIVTDPLGIEEGALLDGEFFPAVG